MLPNFQQFRHFVANTYGLGIAPKAHEDVEIGEECHVIGFFIVKDVLKVLASAECTWVSR